MKLSMGICAGLLSSAAILACSHDRPADEPTTASNELNSSPRSDTAATDRDYDEREAAHSGAERASSDSTETAADRAAIDRDDDGRPRAADDTGKNERDRGDTKTPIDQGNGETDLKITQKIRQAVVADDSLSVTAKNAKIITEGGKVTLRGPVDSARERSAIDAIARNVAGVSAVDNQLEVKK